MDQPLELEPVKFNVIVPTRERSDTLHYTLRTVVGQTYRNLNILVSDNFSSDRTRQVTESFADPRIRYINTGKRVSMAHNWEFALNHVDEGWVTFLGDDDGMLPGALERVAHVIAQTGTSALVSQWRFYFWPNTSPQPGRLTVPCAEGFEVRNCRRWLSRLMSGRAEYRDLPYLYTGGFARVDLINAAREQRQGKRFFCSMNPDVYSAVALASVAQSYVLLREPVCVMGVSSHSNGASNFGSGTPKGPGDLYYSEPNIPFHPALGHGRVKAIELLVYESYLQSLHLHGNSLGISLPSQLALALARADSRDFLEVEKYCTDVMEAQPPGSARLPTGWAHTVRSALGRWLNRARALFRALNDLTVDAAAYHVTDVYGAAHLTAHLHRFHHHDRYWRLRQIAWFLGKRLRPSFWRG